MIEIQNITKTIQTSLISNKVDEIIMDTFIIGYIQGKNQLNTFVQNLELIKNLREFVDINVYTKNQVSDLYNKVLNGNQDIFQLCTLLEENAQNFQSFIKPYQQGFKSQINFYNPLQQNYQQFDDFEELKNLELAKKIQIQLDTEYQQEMYLNEQQEEEIKQLKKLEQEELSNKIECQICLEIIQLIEMATLSCSHVYHQKCLNQYCVTQIQSRQFPVCCPSVDCKKNIIYSDLSEVLDDQHLIEFQKFTFKQFVESHGDEYSWCPTPDCKYVFIADGAQLNCPSCLKSYCLHCKIEYHHGLSCQAYKEKIQNEQRARNEKVLDDQFFQFVQGAKYKQCPQCKFWVEKNQGCNHMTCRCKFQFCYVCGGVYQRCACVQRR